GAYETKSSGDALIKMRIEGEESSYEMVEALSVNATLKSGGRVTMSRHPIEGEAGLKYAIASVAHEAWWTAKTQGGGQGGNGASAAALATDAAKHFVHGQGGFVFGVSGAGGGFAASAAAAEGSDASRHLMATSLGKSMGGGLGGSLKNGADAGQGGGAQQNSAGSQPGAAVGEAIGVRFGHPSGYSARVVCLPGSTPFRPPRLTPKPMIHGLQTAVVTGPSGEEIYTDQYGRIKVLFFWDRGQQASCWIRVAQSIAGKQWGDFYLPRIGQEVVVSFLEGDPDRPLVTGSVYNAANMPPFPLPDNKTQTGYKTHSSVGGGSDQYNELRFEDKIGQEEVYFQAQKDYNRLVKHDDSLKVLHDQTIEITRNRTETVKEGDEKVTIEKGNRTHEITQGDDKLKVGHDRTVEIKNDNEITVDGERKVTIHKDDSLKVEGKHDVKVTKDASLDVEQGNRDVTVTMGDHSITVAMGKSDIKALQSIELTVGSNSIKIDQSGIKIEGLQISIEGSAQTEIKGALIDIKGGLVQIN
ncbi:MAG: type VI secretion system tip protein TssI/VgrG, partial [Stellaceae bacterium]